MKILGIGNAIVDVICKVEDSFLEENSLTKSTMKLVDEKEFKKLLTNLKIEETVSGERNIVVYEDDGENKVNNNFSSLSTVSIMNNYVEKGYEVTNVFEEKVFSEKIEKTIRTVWFKK